MWLNRLVLVLGLLAAILLAAQAWLIDKYTPWNAHEAKVGAFFAGLAFIAALPASSENRLLSRSLWYVLLACGVWYFGRKTDLTDLKVWPVVFLILAAMSWLEEKQQQQRKAELLRKQLAEKPMAQDFY